MTYHENQLKNSYYKEGMYEVWRVIAAWGLNFNRGNVVKYITRAGVKDPRKEIEDLKKAKTYIDFEIERLEEERSNKMLVLDSPIVG